MCGIVGIAGVMPVNQSIYDALTVLQHRGQDAAGIITIDANNCFRLRKANGLVSDVFEARHMQRMQGNMGITTSVTQRQAVPALLKRSLFTLTRPTALRWPIMAT